MSHARTLWEEGHEPGRTVVALGAALALTLVAVDVGIGQGLGLIFDVGFVALCLALALLVRPADFFVVGVLPPLLLLGVTVLLAFSSPATIADPRDGVVQAVVTGLASHSAALGIGYVLCLAVLAMRQHVLRTRTARRRRRHDVPPRARRRTSRSRRSAGPGSLRPR